MSEANVLSCSLQSINLIFEGLNIVHQVIKRRILSKHHFSHIKVQFDTDKVIGIPLEMYVPEENAAIETVSGTEEIETLKAYLCLELSDTKTV